MKQKTITQIGWVIKGKALLNLWGGGQGTIEMNTEVLKSKLLCTKDMMLACVNDGGFGCESIASAEIDIYDLYDNGWKEYNRTIEVSHPLHTALFLGWRKINERKELLGIK